MATLVRRPEVVEFTVAGSYARKYGGSRRASWGAMVGGIVGAFVGVPVPVLGSMVGAFAGAFGGALLAELTVPRAQRGEPVTVAKGALLGRVVAAACVFSGKTCASCSQFAANYTRLLEDVATEKKRDINFFSS